MQFNQIENTIQQLTQAGWAAQNLTEADGYPIWVLTHRTATPRGEGDAPPSVLIDAGIHGEEPASTVGLARWLLHNSRSWLNHINFTVFPCLNPWGYERGIRYSADGKDLNRQFDDPTHPAVNAFTRFVAGRQFDLFVDMHEDCDFEAMYLYELAPSCPSDRPTLGRRILERLRGSVKLSHQEEVGDFQTDDGMVKGTRRLDRQAARELTETPIALHVYAYHAPHIVTVETPGKRSLDLRAKLHVQALEEACTYITEG